MIRLKSKTTVWCGINHVWLGFFGVQEPCSVQPALWGFLLAWHAYTPHVAVDGLRIHIFLSSGLFIMP